jgi:Histidine kinase/Histidine kinase-, DNA gyrase B-, and HSP90-like ATPase
MEQFRNSGPAVPGGLMWPLSKHRTQLARAYAHLESVVLQRSAELQTLSQRLLKVQDEERRKLSRDLHDSTGQTLAALKISVSFLQEHCKQNPSTMLLASDVAGLADQAIEEIRTMSYLLHPPLLDEVGFACAAEWYVEGFAKRTGVNVKLDIATAQGRLPIGIEIALFRVLQESLTNVHRHSGASEVKVCFQHQLKEIVLEIRDDGCGISAERLDRLREASAETGVGLAGMRERMHELNGKLEIESDGHGTTMRAIVPPSAITRSGRLGECGQMTASSIPRGTQRLPGCGICNRPVLLEASKTDEYGQAVHEECYVLNLCSVAEFGDDGASTSDPADRHAINRPRKATRPTMPENWESLRPMQPDVLATMLRQRAKRVSWHKRPWNADSAAVVIVLALSCWIAYSDRHAASFLGSFELNRTTAIEEQVPMAPEKAVPAEDRSKFQTVSIPVGRARTATVLGEVGLAEQEVVHIGQDVTVRYFTPQRAPHRVPVGQYQVVHMGKDVTVRYFTPVGRDTRN